MLDHLPGVVNTSRCVPGEPVLHSRPTMAIGCAYFGVRVVRHAATDMEELAARGYTGVLHTFSENDLAFYSDTMKEIVAASHQAGLEVQVGPWGVGGTFGGEAESRFVAERPDTWQVRRDGTR